MYTEKGKSFGISDEWMDFRAFYNDVAPTYVSGYRFKRVDLSKPFSVDNFIWISDSDLHLLNKTSIVIEIDGVRRTIKEWSAVSGRTAASIANRYRKHKEYTNAEIVYGRLSNPAKKIKSISESENIMSKASKMCSSYRIKDLKKGLKYDIDRHWFLENIAYSKCYYCGDSENIGCDRIDNSIGHTKDNCIPCCYTCNVVRNNLFSVDEMLILGKQIAKIKEQRRNND